jgi:hypothetical protein
MRPPRTLGIARCIAPIYANTTQSAANLGKENGFLMLTGNKRSCRNPYNSSIIGSKIAVTTQMAMPRSIPRRMGDSIALIIRE